MFNHEELALKILIFVKLVLFILLIVFACVYALPLCFLSRFHSPINMMTVHVCLAFIGSAVFWTIVYMLNLRNGASYNIISQERCSIASSIETILNCLVIYSLCTVSINRFCIIRYSNRIMFKSQRWALVCIGITWLITLIVSIPLLISSHREICVKMFGQTFFLELYVQVIVVIFPTVIFALINILIFIYARQSSRRIRVNAALRTVIMNNRDVRLLKHMILIFVIFLSGWSPIYILVCIDFNSELSPIIYRFLSILPALSLLGNMIDLFLFNHQLRLYFRHLFVVRHNRIQPMINNQ
ncbi:unnamed protein product [Rotaria sp. Silwood2]|nr:unnamed protein product [Rotaria sp. Silwood2]CAF2685982.1 unnamed protein product [Rotaria sp. Silwood2]CAF2944746.1 unnamed protein product [Rotaria sp. Silwood2]CAF3089162.1 unnamed protein product [Rotaria sp. Silwood2]CAF4191227.1 unnamed protein product [Rotaria sp. Silwood2]